MEKYRLEFILHVPSATLANLKNALAEFGEGLEINTPEAAGPKPQDFEIKLNTEDPTLVFDICSEFGRIKTVKVNEIK